MHTGVHTLNVQHVSAAAAYVRQWKKLAALAAAGRVADVDLVVWHDGDALPHSRGEIVERVRNLSAAQPHFAV